MGLALLVLPAVSVSGQEPQELTQRRRLVTEHLEVSYRAGLEAELERFLRYADDVYIHVDTLIQGALPRPLTVRLVDRGSSTRDTAGVTVNVRVEGPAEVLFAGELARLATRARMGDVYGLDAYQFVYDGLVAWVAEKYERRAGLERPRWLWASYAYMEEATYLEYLEVYDRAIDVLGRNVVTGVGFSFISLFVEGNGLRGLDSLLEAMARNIDLCVALDDSGVACERFIGAWDSALAAEAAEHDFSAVPVVQSDLLIGGQGALRDVDLLVHLQNREARTYNFFVHYVVDGEPREDVYLAEGQDYRVRVPLGRFELGAVVLWDVAVWSEALQLWIRSGWQNRVVK